MKTQLKKYSVDKNADISMTSFQVIKVQFDTDKAFWGDKNVSNECNLSIKFSTLKIEENLSLFGLLFEVCLVNESKSFSLEIEAYAEFMTTGIEIDDDFMTSGLVTGNAPAIVFPYLRTFITNFCQNSGFNPIILPGFNFKAVTQIND